MKRVLGCAIVLAGTLASSDAFARKSALDPYMWGVGPSVGTIVVPGRYPLQFPSKINKYDFIDEGPRAGDEDSDEPKRDLLDGKQRFTSLERVRDDFRLGFEAFYGVDRDNRVGAGVGTSFGRGFSDLWFTFNYDRVVLSENPFNVIAGVGAGFGSMRFKGTNEKIAGFDNEILRLPYFPIRGRVQGQLRNGKNMFALGAFVQTAVPSNTYYTDLDGKDQTMKSPLSLFLYPSAGLELTMQFGDFTPPKKKPGARPGRGNRGGKKATGGGGGRKGGATKGGGKGGGKGGKRRR